MVSKLNAASRRKADLQSFCQHAGVNHTIAQLQREAMLKIYARKPVPDPTDVLCFGCHADKSYAMVKRQYPEYCSWAMTRLERANATCGCATLRDGWPTMWPWLLSSKQLQTMAATIENLKEEVAARKGQRPRKKGGVDEPNSPSSDFSMVTATKGS